MPGTNETRRFLDALFPDDVPEDQSLLIWTLKARRSFWCRTIDDAVGIAGTHKNDVYVQPCLAPVAISEHPEAFKRRAKASEVTLMPGCWADIDYQDAAHQKQDLPPDEAAALSLLEELPARPTVVVHSGHGLQAWWLFPEPLELETGAERDAAARLAIGWHRLICKKAKAHDWTIDSVFDLARVMRLPGTTNAKGDTPVPCRLLTIHETSCRYTADDLEQFVPPEEQAAAKVIHEQRSSLTTAESFNFCIKADASPPFDKFNVAMTNVETFADTYNGKRKNLASASEVDLSLATQAFGFGWSDQEIIDLLIGYRRKVGKPKLRADYFLATLHKAKTNIDSDESDERLSELVEMTRILGDDGVTVAASSAEFETNALEGLSGALGFKIYGFEVSKAEEPIYKIYTALGSGNIGSADVLLRWGRFEASMAPIIKTLPDDGAKKKWRDWAKLIFNIARDVDIGPATYEALGDDWIRSYLARNPPVDTDLNDEALLQPDQPQVRFINQHRKPRERFLIVDPTSFRHWLRTDPGHAEKISRNDLGWVMRALNGESRTVKICGRSVRRWLLPPELAPTDSADVGPDDHATSQTTVVN